MGNPYVRFDEGRGHRKVPLLLYRFEKFCDTFFCVSAFHLLRGAESLVEDVGNSDAQG